ncbi:MAG: DUF2254 domain-containing protein [Actinomycetota bacterium]|nr:DUF2254 domain-containing protein [Actinomycetota bacterium]MDD5667364.1 DUF2254 domain-containing protein [Actinomycetota bacterium]
MRTRLLHIWEYLRTSFWLVPALMTILAVGFAFLLVFIDRRIGSGVDDVFGFLYSGGPEGARMVLSTIAGSMVTVAGVTFSITIVALQLSSSQFGPRLLRNFMQDLGNQIVLGTYLSSFVYCLLVLRTVHTVEGREFVPSISVAFAVVLALAGVAVLIYFIHHISTSMQAEQVILAVSRDLEEKIQRLFPRESEDGAERELEAESARRIAEDSRELDTDVPAAQSGYLQAVDRHGLLEVATENDLLVTMPCRPGDFVVEGTPLVKVRSKEALDESVARQLAGDVIVGALRTPEQDAEFAVHQLVEVAVRALSPGINDPYTAVSCVDRLSSALCFLCAREFPSPYLYDKEGNLRVVAKPGTFTGIVNAAFDQIRQYGRESAAVTVRMLEALAAIASQSRTREQREAVLRQAEMIERSSREGLHEKNDVEDVQRRYRALLDLLGEEFPDR